MVTCDHTKIMGEIKIKSIVSSKVDCTPYIKIKGNKVLLTIDGYEYNFIRGFVERYEQMERNLTNEGN